MKNVLLLFLIAVSLAWCDTAQALVHRVVKAGKGWYAKTDGTVVVTANYDGKDLVNASLEDLDVPLRLVIAEGVTSIENWKLGGYFADYAFYSVSFPKSLEKVSLIDEWCRYFEPVGDYSAGEICCDSSRILICADTVYAPWETPVGIENGLFQRAWNARGERRGSPLLIVPKGCIDAYRTSDWSRDFACIGDESDYKDGNSTIKHDWPVCYRDWHFSENALFVPKGYEWSNGCEVWLDSPEAHNRDLRLHAELEDGMRSIGDYAFAGIHNLAGITFPESLERIGNYAFSDCSDYPIKLTLPKGLKYIGAYAFEYAYVDPEIPDGCEYLGKRAFYDANLKKVRIPGGLKHWNSAFEYCYHLEEVEFSEDLKAIDVAAFRYCGKLTGTVAQNSSEDNKVLVLPPNLEKIGAAAFYGCFSLRHVVLPASVDTVCNNAFTGCMYKKEGMYTEMHDFRVDCYALRPPVKGNRIIGYNDEEDFIFCMGDLYVPAESVERYKASPWAEEFNIYPLDPDEENPYTALEDVKGGKLEVSVVGGVVSVEGVDEFDVYDISGRKMPAGRPLPAGVYVVSTSKGSERVVVK